MTTTLHAYLAGPINGQPDETVYGWRKEIRAAAPSNVVFIDPADIDYRGREDRHARVLVAKDKEMIRKADLVFCNPHVQSVGTAMEVMYAHMIGVPVLLVCRPGISPWFRAHADYYPPTFADAIVQLHEIARRQETGA